MSTTTNEDQLADVRRRIARLQVLAQTGPVAEIARIERHLDALNKEEASVLAAVRGAPAEAEEKLGQLRTRLAEAAIADVRTQRIAVYDRLAQAREDVNGAWQEQRNHVTSARDELEQKADELSARIN